MSARTPNLAARPFVNSRPVIRISILVGVLGLLLALVNVWSYWSFTQGQNIKRDQLVDVRAAIEEEEARIDELEKLRATIDLESQNTQVTFLNRKIEQRTFSWSLLFDTLAEILPRDVRVSRLSLDAVGPAEPGRRRTSRRSGGSLEAQPGEIVLGVEGEARNYDAYLEFVDALFGSEAFRAVNPSGDTLGQGGVSQFRLQVIYLPRRAAELARIEAAAEEDA